MEEIVKTFAIASLLAMGYATLTPNVHAQATNSMSMASGPVASSATPAPSDNTLAREVRKALSKAPNFSVSNVFVKARGGVVTLSGSVPDGNQLQQATEVATGVPGVKSVSNHLTIYTKGY
jgi:hyperosmotically inducible periplasmic protein